MQSKRLTDQRKGLIIVLFLALAFMLYSCGGGGGSSSGSSSTSTSKASLYITDDISDSYQQVLVTLYKVEFEKSSDKTLVTAFEDTQGVTYDLTELRGIIEKLGSLPQGSYSKVYLTLGDGLILVDNAGNELSPTFNDSNAWTTCSASKCVIEVPGAANVTKNQNVILDFDLKQFTYDATTDKVTAKIVLDADGSKHEGYFEMKSDDYGLKGIIVESIDTSTNSLGIKVIKAKHFMPDSTTVTVRFNSSTDFDCDDDDGKSFCNVSSSADLQVGMKVEVDGTWNGTVFVATKIEVDEDDDIAYTPCTVPDRSMTDYSALKVQPEIEVTGSDPYTFSPVDYTITVSGETIKITKETRIKDETSGSDRVICADSIPSTSNKIEVKYFKGLDTSGTMVNIAYEIEFEN